MPTRVVVANRVQALFYDTARPGGRLRPAGRLENPDGRLHDRDLKSDRPGRVFDRAPAGPGRRGSVAHHATRGERSPQKQVAIRFARRIARELATARREKRYEGLVLIAAPAFLGVLRKALSKPLRAQVAAEVARDFIDQPEEVLRTHIPRRAFPGLR